MGKKKECDLKKHFEAILGAELELEFPGEVAVRERIAAYTEQEGEFTSREIGTTGKSTKVCAATGIQDVSGVAQSGKDGTAELMLSDFICVSSRLRFDYPATVVATPRSESPALVTARAAPTSNRKDVRIRFETWNPDGSPAPRLYINWMCRVPTFDARED